MSTSGQPPGGAPVPRVHLDPAVLAGGPPHAPLERLAPDAAPALRHLVDAGWDLVLLTEGPIAEEARHVLGGHVVVVDGLGDDATGWLIAADEATCAAARSSRRLRTILVGPSVPGRGLASRPSDLEVRTLLDAVLAILAAEAMPPQRGSGLPLPA